MKKGILLILDGYGEGKADKYNAVKNAHTPTLNDLRKLPHALLKTHGESVGLFADEMGNSEVGHTTIGAGRVIKSTIKQINDDIESGVFRKNKILNKALDNLKNKKSDLHLIGLMSDKNIHSNIYHALEIIDMAKEKAQHIYIHFITDGRDCGIRDSIKYLEILKKHIKSIKNCAILSVSGRFYAMDRENYLDRTFDAFNAMFLTTEGVVDAEEYIVSQHKQGVDDQYIKPVHIESDFKKVRKDDLILYFNFREDRLRQIVKKSEELGAKIVTMAEVGNTHSTPLYTSPVVKNTLSEYLSSKGLKQIKISETTKYAHLTYFLNGGEEKPFRNEDRVHIETIETDDYAKIPCMRAKEITTETIKAIDKDYDMIFVNFSNPDMIGHTGNYEATVKALECVDECVEKILAKAEEKDYFVLVTADHGNSEQMKTKNGEPHTAHTINPVMCVIAGGGYKMKKSADLTSIAPTIIDLLGLEKNKYFEGESLI